MKNSGKKIYLTILTIVTVLCVIFGSLYHIGGFVGRLSFLPSIHIGGLGGKNTEMETEFDEPVKTIKIDASVFDLTVTNGSEYALSYAGSEELAPIVEQDKDTVTIKQKKKVKVNSLEDVSCQLTLTIPESGLKTLDINLDLGDIDMSDVNVGKLTIDADLGDIEGNKINAKKVEIDANLGNVVLNTADFEDLSINADMGDIEIYSVSDLADHKIEAETETGVVSYYGKDFGRSYSQYGKAGDISIDVEMGDIKLR